MNFNILEGNVSKSYSWLSGACTFFIKRIKHASRPVSIRLFHLLWTNIYCPPERSIHCKISIVYILNQSISLISGIRFNINAFNGPCYIYIPKSNIPNTIASSVWRHTSHTHSNPKHNSCVLNKHISCTIPIHKSTMTGFRHNNVIEILNSDIIDVHSCSAWINSISI